MGAVVFDNEIFDSWLTKKSDEILSKVDRGPKNLHGVVVQSIHYRYV